MELVRDDFWMAATRFMRELEIHLLEGHNSATADLFDPRHARKVLAAFGRAYGTLPDPWDDAHKPDAPARDVGPKPDAQARDVPVPDPRLRVGLVWTGGRGELPPEEQAFLDQAVAGLAEDGKVVCIRLALFAEMMKGWPWTPASLTEVGGAAGMGVTFLEQTFSARSALPQHRYHDKAVRTVLQVLLPEQGTDIKGHMCSRDDLLVASGYGDRPREFDDLLSTLDTELRLITPSEATESEISNQQSTISNQQFFQLTHDYLVPSLRDWLTRKQRETRRARAELCLAERTAAWSHTRENRHLPDLWEYLSIRCFTSKRIWTEPQRQMMGTAVRYHALRFGAAGLGFECFPDRWRETAMTESRRAILQALEAIGDRYPDMRFGQLVVNVANWATRQPDALWDVEDEEFLQAITTHLNRTACSAEQPVRAPG